jgi:hypothetical protein
VELPGKGRMVTKGSPLFSIQQGNLSLPVLSPVSGKITDVNAQLLDNPELIKLKPYELGWICKIEPSKLTADLKEMRVGEDAVAWYREEIERFSTMKKDIAQANADAGAAPDAGEDAASDVLSQATWDAFSQTFINH